MVFYFTGTGNSRWAAEELGKAFGEPLISMAEALKEGEGKLVYPLGTDEKVFFVFPIHSWGPAVLVPQFIKRLGLEGYNGQPVYSICTCGDECGYTDRMMRKALAEIGVSLTGNYSVKMPNNYILLPGFDVDSKEVEADKLRKAPERLQEIIGAIGKQNPADLYYIGGGAFWKTYLVYPLFAKFSIGSNQFRATDACVSCGICAKVCPTGTITMREKGKPEWTDTCVQCLACIHRCPTRAIEYGKVSVKKGRYHHPDIKNKL